MASATYIGGQTGQIGPIDLGSNPDGDALLEALEDLGLIEYTGSFNTGV